MGDMPMAGGWTMSMMWMRMPDQSWAGAAASFVGMWTVMMGAMMLPSLAPVLWRYRQAVGRAGGRRTARLTAVVAIAYFMMWTLFGAALFPLGAALAAVAMREPGVAQSAPIAAGLVVLLGGALQFTAWKARYLECCREEHWRGRFVRADVGSAWRQGVRLAVHCGCCSSGFTAILLALGVMDLRVMSIVAVASTAERLAPDGDRVARFTGLIAVGAGLCLIVLG